MPLVVDDAVERNLRVLLEQDELWVRRSRWPRWLRQGDPADAVTIDTMLPDDRLAARAWLAQQRHVLHQVLDGSAERAPDGWLDERPLYVALQD